ncbi:MAG: GDP-mannose 4,6-dehydratase [Bacteriovoracaceae bacterium]|nr:GDP-mannose 4,6-dehydratase [Bacteriovoracaceae bacterium]
MDEFSKEDEELIQNMPGPILILGVSGFIGARLFSVLNKRRPDVFGASNNTFDNWRIRLLKKKFKDSTMHFIKTDVSHRDSLKKIFLEIKPLTILNLSAYGAYQREEDSALIHQVNYLGVLNILSLAKEFSVKAFVNTGSSSEYGLNCSAPKESAEPIPNSDYSVAKLAASYLIIYYGKMQNIPCNHLRLYSVYGPWEDSERLIPKIIQKGLVGEFPPLAEAEISRDFLYVDDCIRGIIFSATSGCTKYPGEVYNLGSEVKTTLKDIVDIISQKLKIFSEPSFATFPNRKWDTKNWYSDSQKIWDHLGWKYSVTFEKGLDKFIAWQRSFSVLEDEYIIVKQKKISAIVACYKDNQAIPYMYQKLKSVFQMLKIDYEIIFVNDCSPYNDEDVIRQISASDDRVIGITHTRNFGSQSAFLSGMTYAMDSDAVVLLDGDLQDPPEIIAGFYQKWIEGNDVVYGVRVKRDAPFLMQISYKLFYRVFRSLSDIIIPVDAGDFSLIDAKVVKQMLRLKERDFFLRGIRAWVGFKQIGFPYVRPERMFGVSTNNFLKNIWWAKKAIFSYSIKPLEYIQRLGMILFLLGIVMITFYFYMFLFSPVKAPRGITTIIILLIMLGGIQMLSISVLGDYIGKILEEAKGRPRYIVKHIFKNGVNK